MKTILVVDDEPSIREMLQTFLQEEGYEVIVATHGREGLERMSARLPDLVLSDMMMPVWDGRELVRRMRANPRTRGVPVILMSAGAPPADIDPSQYAALVSKPFDLFPLLDLIERLLKEG